VYETPEQFVERAKELIEKPSLRAAIVANAKALVRDRFNPAAERRAYARVIALAEA
jgi:hypothetical protein